MPLALALLGLLAAAPAGATAAPEDSWRETPTPHFSIKHQSAFLPAGLTMGAERVHAKLQLDLAMFAPWMAREKIGLYVYDSREDFLAGKFHPPSWSNGLAVFEAKAVAMPTMKDIRKQLQVMAHETTHLLFDSYWRGARVPPPAWLNEGLAMVQEADRPDKPETSIWFQVMTEKEPRQFPSLEAFFGADPQKLGEDQNLVGLWYTQAYSVTYYLLRKHSRLQFKQFAGSLRDGKPVAEALWLSYRYRSVGDLESRWRAWLADPSLRSRVNALPDDVRNTSQDSLARGEHLFKFFRTGYTVGGSASRLDPALDPRARAR